MQIILERPSLKPSIEKERKALLIVSAVGLAVAWAHFFPEGFEILGIKSGKLKPEGFTKMLVLIISYFLISFCAHAVIDWKSWKWKISSSEKAYETLSELNENSSNQKNIISTSIRAIFVNKIIFSKIIFDLVLPIAVGGYALNKLMLSKPPTVKSAEIISIVSSREPKSKSSIVFVNTRTTFINERNSETLATFIIPFKDEASCPKSSSKIWGGTKVDKLHKPFLKRLGKDLSQCGIKGKPIILLVKGFSSSSDFTELSKCKKASSSIESSDEANLFVANERRDNVIEYLSKEKGEYLIINPHIWGNTKGEGYDNMKKERDFNDRSISSKYSISRGQLNRRVEVQLLKAGDCEISSP